MKKFALISFIFILIISASCALAESNSPTNSSNIAQIEIFVHGISNNSIKEATILITPNSSEMPKKNIYLFTNSNGNSIALVNPGTYDFSIQAKDYLNETKTITIFNGSPQEIEFTLFPETSDIWVFFLPIYLGFFLYVCWLCGSSEKMKFVFILFLFSILVPFLCLMSDWSNTMFFYVSLFLLIFLTTLFMVLYLYFCKKLPFVQKWEDCSIIISKVFSLVKALLTILTILSWSFIACYFACEGVETVVISSLNSLEFPTYIVIGVTIGVLSYLMLTIKYIFIQLFPAQKKKSIVWECTRRIIIAPYVAIMGIYLIFYIGAPMIKITHPDAHFAFLFSIFAGMFTSTIEEWIYSWVRSTLSLKEEQSEISKYDIDKSSLANLGMSEDMIYQLYYEANIDNKQILANSDAHIVFDKLKAKYPENEIKYYIDLAKNAKT